MYQVVKRNGKTAEFDIVPPSLPEKTYSENPEEAYLEVYNPMEDSARLKENPLITIAEVRDLLGTSRKSAKPILEYMDSIKVTKKNGTESERVAYV